MFSCQNPPRPAIDLQMIVKAMIAIALTCLASAASGGAPTRGYADLTSAFDRFAVRTAGHPAAERVRAFRREFDPLFPGFYRPRGRPDYDRTVARALADYPAIRQRYLLAAARFPDALADATTRFRQVYPSFRSPMSIWLVHSLGEMDGGTREIEGRNVAVFGADMIARYDLDRMRPFLEHELTHVEHARHFADCDPLWCTLWQEGLAVYAASRMSPEATDHDLLLTDPAPLRAAVDGHWGEALCLTRASLDSTNPQTLHRFFFLDGKNQTFPIRFGYYVGYRLMRRAAAQLTLPELTNLGHGDARAVLDRAIALEMTATHTSCRSL